MCGGGSGSGGGGGGGSNNNNQSKPKNSGPPPGHPEHNQNAGSNNMTRLSVRTLAFTMLAGIIKCGYSMQALAHGVICIKYNETSHKWCG